jgi:hypothetical protein
VDKPVLFDRKPSTIDLHAYNVHCDRLVLVKLFLVEDVTERKDCSDLLHATLDSGF